MMLPEDITEDEALALLHKMKNRFGWAVKVWTRADAEDVFSNIDFENHEAVDGFDPKSWVCPDMSDELWQRVRNSSYWHRSLEECRDHEWDCVSGAVEEALGRDA